MKKIKGFLSVLLCVTLLVCYLPLFRVDVSAEQASNRLSVIHVRSADDLIEISNNVNNGNRDYSGYIIRLTTNIDLDGKEFTPIGNSDKPFRGIFDGQGYEIRGFFVDEHIASTNALGFFGVADGAIITNFTVSGKIVVNDASGALLIGGIVGYIINTEVTNCISNVDIQANTNKGIYAGGIVGTVAYIKDNNCIIRNCHNLGNINLNAQGMTSAGGGGICGRCYIVDVSTCIIENCSNQGDIITFGKNDNDVFGGGIIAYASSYSGYTIKIADTYNSGNITINNEKCTLYRYAGGIAAYADAFDSNSQTIVTDCYNTGALSGGSVGGICGRAYNFYSKVDFRNCYNIGRYTNLVGTYQAGGIIGRNYNTALGGCYYVKSQYYSGGMTLQEMQEATAFSTFDFSKQWVFVDGDEYVYPQLINNLHHKNSIQPYDFSDYNIVNIGILEDYGISVNLDSGVNWISDITVDGIRYPVEQGVLALEQAQKLENKKILFVCSNGSVDEIYDLNECIAPSATLSNDFKIVYKNGKFTNKKIKFDVFVLNSVINQISTEFTEFLKPIDSLLLTDINVELISSNKGIIYFKEGISSSKKQSIQFNVDGVLRPGDFEKIQQNFYVNTDYLFPKDKASDTVTLTCSMAAKKNGEVVTSTVDYNITLTNKDYGQKKNWETQSVDELLEQMETEVKKCPVLTGTEVLEVTTAISAIRISNNLSNFQNNYEMLEFTYDMACYFYDLKYPTVGDAGAAFLDAIISECETASDELKGELRSVLRSLADSQAVCKFIHWYNNKNQNILGNKKENGVHCPVDVSVTDEDGNVVLSIVDDEVVYEAEGAAGFVCDGKKTIYLPTDINHNIQITPTGNGTMDYSVTEYSENGEEIVVAYEDIKITSGKVLSGNVTMESMPEEGSYELTQIAPNKLSFSSASVILQDNIGINIGVNKTLFFEGRYKEPFILFELNGEKTVVSDYRVVNGEYVFNFSDISSLKANDTLKATIYATYDGTMYVSETKTIDLVLPGDVQCDNKLNLKDLVTAAQYVAGWDVECNTKLVDVNNDATEDLSDVVSLSRYLAGWNDCALSFMAFTVNAIIGDDVEIDMSQQLDF